MKNNNSTIGTKARLSRGSVTGPPRRILVADDDPGIRDVLSIIFRDLEYVVDIKEDGIDLLSNKFIVPDLFLIDKQLSGSCGLDICRYLKSQPKTKHVPVILISASPDIGKLAHGAGADDYIEKPFELKKLLAVIRSHIATQA